MFPVVMRVEFSLLEKPSTLVVSLAVPSLFLGSALVVGADFKPFVWFEEVKFACTHVQLRACYGLNPGLDLVGGEITIHVYIPKACRFVVTPSENLVLV